MKTLTRAVLSGLSRGPHLEGPRDVLERLTPGPPPPPPLPLLEAKFSSVPFAQEDLTLENFSAPLAPGQGDHRRGGVWPNTPPPPVLSSNTSFGPPKERGQQHKRRRGCPDTGQRRHAHAHARLVTRHAPNPRTCSAPLRRVWQLPPPPPSPIPHQSHPQNCAATESPQMLVGGVNRLLTLYPPPPPSPSPSPHKLVLPNSHICFW